jgi:hypothetical protein
MKIFVLGIVLLLSSSCLAQFNALPDSCTIWKYQQYDWTGAYMGPIELKFEPNQTVDIGGTDYMPITQYKAIPIQVAVVREDSGTAYVVPKDSIVEFTLIDMNVSIGDTVKNIATLTDQSSNWFTVYEAIVLDSIYVFNNAGVRSLMLELGVIRTRDMVVYPYIWSSAAPIGSLKVWWVERGSLATLDGLIDLMQNNPVPSVSGGEIFDRFCSMDDSLAPIGSPEECANCPVIHLVSVQGHLQTANSNVVYPNVSSTGIFTLRKKINTLIIYNSLGAIVYQGSQSQFDLSQQSDGIFYCHVETYSGQFLFQKIIKLSN